MLQPRRITTGNRRFPAVVRDLAGERGGVVARGDRQPRHGGVALADRAKSDLERNFRRLLIKHGIELPLRNAEIGPWEVDCLRPAQRLVVELDGRQHTRPAQAARDDDRDLYLRRHGHTIRRYGDKQFAQQPEDVLVAFAEARVLGLSRAA